MRVVRAYPPNYAQIVKAFPHVRGRQGILYALDGTIYNPSGVSIQPWHVAHEEKHQRQQHTVFTGMDSPYHWWDLYLVDPEFRLRQEIEAHQVEWLSYLEHTNGKASLRNQERHLDLLAQRLSSPLYGNLIDQHEARKVITRGHL